MFNRWLGIVSLVLMVGANAALVLRDLVPGWTAGDPPRPQSLCLQAGQVYRTQTGLYQQAGLRIGTVWTESQRSTASTLVTNWMLLEPLTLSREAVTPRLLIFTKLSYPESDQLGELELRVLGLDVPVELRGEFVPPNEFPCEWRFGDRRGSFILSARALRSVGDVFKPFESLPGLKLGQTWRMQLFNPLAGLFPGWQLDLIASQTALARVTRIERLEIDGVDVETHVVETDGVRAWVDPGGRVLRQEVELPLLGNLTVVDEPFELLARERVLLRLRHR